MGEALGREVGEERHPSKQLLEASLGLEKGGGEEVAEGDAPEREEQRRARRAPHCRRARLVIEQSNLAEGIAWCIRAGAHEAWPVAAVAADVGSEGALGDEVELVARLALREDGVALARVLRPHCMCDFLEHRLVEVNEQVVRA